MPLASTPITLALSYFLPLPDMKLVPVGKSDFASVDDADYESVAKYKWYLLKRKHLKYAVGLVGKKNVLMHRLILKTRKGLVTDHKDRNGLNNCRSNLRECTHSQNMRNAVYPKRSATASKYKGVARCGKYWIAQMSINGKPTKLGYFKDEDAAARMYDAHALRVSGLYARLNFPKQK